jgi:hypothetical protein
LRPDRAKPRTKVRVQAAAMRTTISWLRRKGTGMRSLPVNEAIAVAETSRLSSSMMYWKMVVRTDLSL